MATVWYGAKQSGNIDIEIKHTQVVLWYNLDLI
jgi:hypothetical protein